MTALCNKKSSNIHDDQGIKKMETRFSKLEEHLNKQISSMSDRIEYLTQELAVPKGSVYGRTNVFHAQNN